MMAAPVVSAEMPNVTLQILLTKQEVNFFKHRDYMVVVW